MTSTRQIEANRKNALNSTGPRTAQGKRRSRRNAFRHGLAAETVVNDLEDPHLYAEFHAAILSDYAPETAVEHELVLRLVSLLWRLRRATAIESGLFEMHVQKSAIWREETTSSQIKRPDVLRQLHAPSSATTIALTPRTNGDSNQYSDTTTPSTPRNVAECYVRAVHLTDDVIERLGRYEKALWRQIRQIDAILDTKKQNRITPSSEGVLRFPSGV